MARTTVIWSAAAIAMIACGGAVGTASTFGGSETADPPSGSSGRDVFPRDADRPEAFVDCKPLDCAKQGIECGAAGDGCGGRIDDCGTCSADLRCGGPGAPSKCVSPNIGGCVPKSCADKAIECGPAFDDCGGMIGECGPCDGGMQCGNTDASARSKCVIETPDASCTALTCAELGVACGKAPNGCGGLTADCGTCTGNTSCKNGACVTACTPATCSEIEAECGYVANGCGGTIDCGVCPDGFICGANGKPNRCGGVSPF